MSRGGRPVSPDDVIASVRIVPVAMDHVDGFNQCVSEVAHERRYIGLVVGPTLDQSHEFVRRLLAGGGVQRLAIDPDRRVVGWCDIFRRPLEGFRHCGRLGMGLLPGYRGRGLGRRLATATMDAAIAAGMERIELEVFASNHHAIALYERLGFIREGVQRRARFLDGRYEDNVLMAFLAADRDDPGGGDRAE